jgi:hypothetical protein
LDVAVDPALDESDLPAARLTPLAAKLAAEFGFAKESFARGSLVRKEDVLRRAGSCLPRLPQNLSRPVRRRRPLSRLRMRQSLE